MAVVILGGFGVLYLLLRWGLPRIPDAVMDRFGRVWRIAVTVFLVGLLISVVADFLAGAPYIGGG